MQRSAALGSRMGTAHHTGDGKFDGETFLGRTWMFVFLKGTGKGKRKRQGKYC